MTGVQLNDRGWARFKKGMLDLKKQTLFVGVLDQDSELAMIASWLEFGTDDGHIPERPVHRITFENLRPELKRKYAEVAKLVTEGKISAKQGLSRIGSWYAGKLRWEIIRYNAVPNADSTIRQKGFDDPLMDTGNYVNSINWDLR